LYSQVEAEWPNCDAPKLLVLKFGVVILDQDTNVDHDRIHEQGDPENQEYHEIGEIVARPSKHRVQLEVLNAPPYVSHQRVVPDEGQTGVDREAHHLQGVHNNYEFGQERAHFCVLHDLVVQFE
jgi:hypothetical protein